MIGKASDTIPRTNRTRAARIIRDDIEGEDVIVVPEFLSKLSQKGTVFGAKK